MRGCTCASLRACLHVVERASAAQQCEESALPRATPLHSPLAQVPAPPRLLALAGALLQHLRARKR